MSHDGPFKKNGVSRSQLNQRIEAGEASAAKRTKEAQEAQAALMRSAKLAKDQAEVNEVRQAEESFRTGGVFKPKAAPPCGALMKPEKEMPPQDVLNETYVNGAALNVSMGLAPWIKPTKEQLEEAKKTPRESKLIHHKDGEWEWSDIVDAPEVKGKPVFSQEWFDALPGE